MTELEIPYVDPLKYGAPLNDREVAVNAVIVVLPVTGVCVGTLVLMVVVGAQNISTLLAIGVL